MSEHIYETIEELMEKAAQAEGKSMRSIDKYNRLGNAKNKGMFGHIIEESHFEYAINSDSNADFKELGIELKVTPVKRLKNGAISVKERLVLNVIDYMKEYKLTFETSSFMNKNEKILLMFYLWDESIKDNDYTIVKSHLMQFNEDDLYVIKNDWQIIVEKIKAGKAHEISEADTNYLSACTKGASASSTRQQPFSDIPAKQRAFSYKVSYMNTIVRQLMNHDTLTSIIKDDSLKTKTLTEILEDKFRPYYEKSFEEISDQLQLGLTTKTKNYVQLLASAILGVRGTSLDDIEEFSKANIKIKTIRLKANGKLTENMSFPTFKFMDIIEQNWEDSQLYEIFSTQKFLFVVFQYDEHNNLIFKKIKIWNMPYDILENQVRETWEETVRVIKEGIEFIPKGKVMSNNLPGSSFNNVCHVRPHARNAADTFPLPDGRSLTKQCFWLDAKYLFEVISE